MKRIISLVLAAVLLLGMVPIVASAAETHPSIALNSEVIVSMEENGGTAMFSFVPAESGTYIFYSYNNDIDTCAYLYDAQMNEILYDDDLGGDYNFLLCFPLTAGEQYYFKCESLDPDVEEGKYSVKLEKAPAATGVEIEEIPDAYVGMTYCPTISFSPEHAAPEKVTWSSDNEAVLTVDEFGMITFVSVGTANLSVTSENGLTDTIAVTVKELPILTSAQSVPISIVNNMDSFVKFVPEESADLRLYVSDLSNKENEPYLELLDADLGWLGDSGSGELDYPFVAGETYYVRTNFHSFEDEGNGTYHLNVGKIVPATSISITEGSAIDGYIKTDRILHVSFHPFPAYKKELQWSSSNDEIVSVDPDGVIYMKAAGTATITATDGDDLTASCVVTVKDYPTITMDTEKTITLDGSGAAYFYFTPERDGKYLFYSESEDLDPFCTILSASGEEVANGDDSDEGSENSYDFYFTAELSAGTTYTIKADAFAKNGGTFLFGIKEAPHITAMELISAPYTKNYIQGMDPSSIDYYGLHLKLIWSDGSTRDWGYYGSWFVWEAEDEITVNTDTIDQDGKVVLSIEDATLPLAFTLLENPVQSIEVQNASLVEHTNGSFLPNGDFYYQEIPFTANIILKDGTVIHDTSFSYEKGYYNISVDMAEAQKDAPWTLGNTYTLTATLLGCTDTFSVTIVDTPLQSFTVEDVVLYEEIDWMGGFSVYPDISDFVMKDGEQASSQGDYLIYNNWRYYITTNIWELQEDERWTAGNTYQVTARVLGAESTFNVTIEENPIEKLELVKAPDKTEYLEWEFFDLKGATVRVKYKDGGHEDMVFSHTYTGEPYYKLFTLEKIDREGELWFDNGYALQEGTQAVEAHLFGQTLEIPITVKKNPAQSITVKENSDKTLTFTVTCSDNTQYDMKVLDMQDAFIVNEEGYYGKYLATDKGVFIAFIDENNEDAVTFYMFDEENAVKSNTIPLPQIFTAHDVLRDYRWAYGYCRDDQEIVFDGTITADNIDDVIQIAGEIETFNREDYEYDWKEEPRVLVPGAVVKEFVKKHFAVQDIDLTLSQHYDAQKDIYRFFELQMGGSGWPIQPDSVSFANGVWTMKTQSNEDHSLQTVMLDSDMKIIGINTAQKSLSSISVTTPTKTVYVEGESFDSKGMTVTAHYSDNSTTPVTGYTVSGYTSSVGTKTITVSFGGKTATFTVTVKKVCDIKGHSFGAYVYNKDATNAKDGTKTRICSVCKKAETVTAVGTKLVNSAKTFTDVAVTWYTQYVDYAVTHGIFKGTSGNTFSPNTNMTRAQVVQVFANLAGVDTTNKNVVSGFSDVPKGEWYTAAVTWAAKNGVVSGVGGGKFAPESEVTREQACVILVNFVEKYQKGTMLELKKVSAFADDKDISNWAKTAVYKCAKAGIVNGVGNNMFSPKANATRAQGATIFTNFHKSYMK